MLLKRAWVVCAWWHLIESARLSEATWSEDKSKRSAVPRKRAAGTNEGETKRSVVEAEGTTLTRATMGAQRTGRWVIGRETSMAVWEAMNQWLCVSVSVVRTRTLIKEP